MGVIKDKCILNVDLLYAKNQSDQMGNTQLLHSEALVETQGKEEHAKEVFTGTLAILIRPEGGINEKDKITVEKLHFTLLIGDENGEEVKNKYCLAKDPEIQIAAEETEFKCIFHIYIKEDDSGNGEFSKSITTDIEFNSRDLCDVTIHRPERFNSTVISGDNQICKFKIV